MKNSTKRRSAQPRPAARPSAPPRRAAAMMVVSTLLLGACVYRIPIQQGNYLDPAAIVQVKVGMTRSQVRYLLGTPMVPGSFDNSRWDYDYYLKTRRLQNPRRGHVTIHFEKDVVARVDTNVTAPPQIAAPTAAELKTST